MNISNLFQMAAMSLPSEPATKDEYYNDHRKSASMSSCDAIKDNPAETQRFIHLGLLGSYD